MMFAIPHAGVPGPLQFFTMTQSNFSMDDAGIYFSPGMRVGLICDWLFHPGMIER